MTWFLRALEQDDGSWACRFGAIELGVMPDESSAVAFLADTAAARGGRDRFEIYLHHLDGRLDRRPASAGLPEGEPG